MFLLTVSPSGFSKEVGSWFCVGEKFTYITHNDGEVLSSNYEEPWPTHKWIVDKNGLRTFEDDVVEMSRCEALVGGGVHCSTPGFPLDHFVIFSQKIFRINTVRRNNSTGATMHIMVVGKCREITT
jgi:hypothetical protein